MAGDAASRLHNPSYMAPGPLLRDEVLSRCLFRFGSSGPVTGRSGVSRLKKHERTPRLPGNHLYASIRAAFASLRRLSSSRLSPEAELLLAHLLTKGGASGQWCSNRGLSARRCELAMSTL